MHKYHIPPWKKAPFLRLLFPLVAGILLHHYLPISLQAILFFAAFNVAGYATMLCLPFEWRFRLQSFQGLLVNGLLVGLGMFVGWQTDVRNRLDWYGNYYTRGDCLLVRVDEAPVKKPKTWKANAQVEAIMRETSLIRCTGKLLIYLSAKDTSNAGAPGFGDRFVFDKGLQAITSSGNPGAFDYAAYAARQQLFHRVYLERKDWRPLPETRAGPFRKFIFSTREMILRTLSANIGSGGEQLGIAEALLIGYTNDLDRDLVQAYSNTGVVHIIAISGMHLALIYLLLVRLFGFVPLLNQSRSLQVLLILSALWLFSLLTGASASVLRAAVMFTFITIGNNLKRQSSIYNSLGGSAFLLLCFNSNFLWDAGFQLSYLAVISIVAFQKSITNWWYIPNKWLFKVWELAAVSIAAQVLTFPICIYYFHQFPNYFLLTNMVAVPLSGLILYAEISLVALSWLPAAGKLLGTVCGEMVGLMNRAVLQVNALPGAVWPGIAATPLSTWLLYAVVVLFTGWLMHRQRHLLYSACTALLAFFLVGDWYEWQAHRQQLLIIYNIPRQRAIDIVKGNNFYFIGDGKVTGSVSLLEPTLQPTRLAMHLNKQCERLAGLFRFGSFLQYNYVRILLVDSPFLCAPPLKKIKVDLVLLSHNARTSIGQLASVVDAGQYVFDASNSLWKIEKWRKECEELHLRSYSVPGQGALLLAVPMTRNFP